MVVYPRFGVFHSNFIRFGIAVGGHAKRYEKKLNSEQPIVSEDKKNRMLTRWTPSADHLSHYTVRKFKKEIVNFAAL